MLSESLQELLSAYVDGELVPAEYERVMAALRDSASARDYVKHLREMSCGLKDLPKLTIPRSFSAQYLKHDRRIQRIRRAMRWAAVGAAAAALVTGWTLWPPRPGPLPPPPGPGVVNVAVNGTHNTPIPVSPPVLIGTPKPDLTWLAAVSNRAMAWSREELDRLGIGINDSLTYLANAAVLADARNQAKQKELLAAPAKELGNPFRSTAIELPLLVSSERFNVTEFQKRWGKKGLFQADLLCTDTLDALVRLNEACKRNGVALILDEEVHQRLAKRLPAPFVVYLENIKEDTLFKVWSTLEGLDHWTDRTGGGNASCQSIEFRRPDNEECKHFARCLGIEAEKLVTPSTAVNQTPQQAVVVGYHPTRLAETLSHHVRQAITSQSGPRTDSVSVLFLLRSPK